MMNKYKKVLYTILFFLLTANYISAQERPNIVVILSDDQGYADISFNPEHADYVSTPNMDALANNGIYFSNAYLTGNTCSPSRAGIMTGRYQHRESIYDSGEGGSGLSLNSTIFPEFLPAEYVSAAFGKWHLGLTTPYSPASRGFDEFYGFLGRGGHDYFDFTPPELPLYNGIDEITGDDIPVGYLTDILTDEAVSFIEREKDNPFFCYLAYNAVHTPAQAPDETFNFFNDQNLGITERRTYLMAMLKHLDDGVGRVIQTLEDNQILDNTIVIFLTDNGGAAAMEADTTPLRGTKQTNYEGGIRTPFIFSWPIKYPNHATISAPISAMDILPTILDVTDTPLPTDKPFDGRSLIPLIEGDAQSIHNRLYWNEGGNEGEWAIRQGNWKLIANKTNLELFNLNNDPSEANDLSDTANRQDRITSMITDYNTWLDEMPVPKDQTKQWAPEISNGSVFDLYSGYYYNGNTEGFTEVGVYNSSDLGSINDNETQSIVLADGFSAYGFTEDNLQGERYLLTSSTPFLGELDKKLSSLYVFASFGDNGKNISVTSNNSNSEPENILDNDYDSHWESPNVGNQLDFAWCEPVNLSGIEMGFIIGNEGIKYTFHIEVSEDGTNWTRVVTNAQSSGSDTNVLESFDFPETYVQHLRIIGRGNTINNRNHYTEIDFKYGTGADSGIVKIEAEDYNASVNTSNTITTDCDGLLDVSQTTNDASLSYDINLSKSASNIDIRCKPLNEGTIRVLLNDSVIEEFAVNSNVIDDTYKTLSIPASIPVGSHTLTLNFVASNTNLPVMGNFNWIKLINTDSSLSIENIRESKFEITLFPNPASNSLNISSNIDIEKLSVIDISGKEIKDINVNLKNYTLNTSNLKSGMYFLMLKNKGAIQYKKFVKK